MTQFGYHIFIKPTLSFWLDVLLILTLGLSASISIPFTILVDFGSSFFTLYWTNQVYEAFHPVVAPEIAEAKEKQ